MEPRAESWARPQFHCLPAGKPAGKPAGVPCVHLDADRRCRLFGLPTRPPVCASLQPSPAMCGPDTAHAIRWLTDLERQTTP